MSINKIRVIFFVGGIFSGGKERRLLELLCYLKKNDEYEMLLITTSSEVHYDKFLELNIVMLDISRDKQISKYRYPIELIKICKNFRPHIIHTWGRFQTFYALPSKLLLRLPLINGQVTNASPIKSIILRLVDKVNFYFSNQIIANSKAGIKIYKAPAKKTTLIYNGFNMDRFQNLKSDKKIKEFYGINKPYVILMAATFSKNKDQNRFFELAEYVSKQRDDIMFISAGFYELQDPNVIQTLNKYQAHPNIKIMGMVKEIESLINIVDIGVLFSNSKVHGEGLSNSILEYMALGKPVIANHSGGTEEIVINQFNGLLVREESLEQIAATIIHWLESPEKRNELGKNGQHMVRTNFTIEKMGQSYVNLYKMPCKN
jgi:glycosyltransferase involved in cell wall biosynthesis